MKEVIFKLPDEVLNIIIRKVEDTPQEASLLEKLIYDGEERKTGKWISEMVDGVDWKGCKRQYYQPISCSKCHSPNHCKSTYCPNCGAKMEEVK